MEDATPPPLASEPESPPPSAEEGEPAVVASPAGSLIVPPDFLSASGLLDTRTSAGEESLGLRVVYLAQGRLDAQNVHYALISGIAPPPSLSLYRAELYTWGSGAFGRLGHGSTDDEARPRLVEALAKQRIRWVACGWDTTAAVTEHGELYLWGSGEAIPRSVSFPGEGALRVVKVCLGEAHAAVLSERGDVYTFGAFAHGRKTKRVAQRRQRGQKGWARDPQPRIVYNLPNGQTRNIACGSHHILALTSNGKVYSWGDGSWGKLGHGSETEEWLPRPIEAFEEQTIVQIDAGDDHSVFLSSDGTVWTCGCPHDGRLGLTKEAIKEHQEEFAAEGPKKDAAILVPSPVGGSLASHQAVSICAGAVFTLCRTLTKEIFYFGKPEFDEALGIAHSPTALAIESYPLSAMFSRAYRSMIINDDKKAASAAQRIVPRDRHGAFLLHVPRKIATVKGIWDKRGKTLSDHDAETLRQAVAARKTNAAKSQIARRISDSQLGDEEMVGRNCPDQETSSVSAHVTTGASATPESKPQAQELVASSQSFAAPTPTATTSTASKTSGDSAQPTSEQVPGTEREIDDVERADHGSSQEETSIEQTTAPSEEKPLPLPATEEVDQETLQHQNDADSDNGSDQHSDGDDEEDIRGETPRQRPDDVSHTPEEKETDKEKKEVDDNGSATEGEDEEDIRLETPRAGDQELRQDPASAKEGDGIDSGDDHALTEGEDEEDIRGEELSPGQTPRKLPLEAVAGRSRIGDKGKKDEEDDDDEPTEGEDEEDIRGETPRGKETSADQVVKGISFSGSTISKFSDDDDDDTLTEGDDEQDIRGEDDEPLWVDVHLAAVAQMEKSTTKEERRRKKKNSSREKKPKKKQPEPKSDEDKVVSQEHQQKKEEGNSARRIVRNISLKLIGKSATIERDAPPKEKKNKKTKGLKKSHTLTASPRISRDRPSAESDEHRGKLSADSLSAAVKTVSGSLSGDAVTSVAEGEDSGQWMAATAASPVRRRSRGFLMRSGRMEETSADNAAGEDGEGSKKKEHRKSREKLSIRRSVSCEPSVGHADEPSGGDEASGGLLKVQIRHSQEVESKRKSREVAEKRASKEVDNNGASARERRVSGGFAEKAIERRSKELHMGELEKAANDKSGDVSEDAPASDKPASPSPFKKFHTIGRAHRKRNKTINSGAVSDSMEAVPTKQKRFSISTPFHSFSSTNRTRTNFTQEGAKLKEFERRLKNIKPGALEDRAALLKEWAEFLLAQQASKKGGSVTDSPSASPLASPKKGRFGTLRRRKKEEEKDSATEELDEDVAGTIINNEEILLRLQSGEMIRLAYKETKRGWVEDRSASPEVSVSPPPSPSPPTSPSASPAGSPRTPGRSRLPRVPLFRTHSLSLNFLRGGGSEKKSDRIDRNGGEGESCSETAGGKNLSRQKSDARIGASVVDRLTKVEEESFSDVWRREKERQLAEAEEQKRQAERKQRKKQKEKEWALKGEAKESERSKERQSVREDEHQHSRHSESDYSSSDLKLEATPESTTHSTEPCEQEA